MNACSTPIFIPVVHLYPLNAGICSCPTFVPVGIVSTPLLIYACFRKALNLYQKVQIVWCVCVTIKILLLQYERSCMRLVPFTESSAQLVPLVSQDVIFRLCEAENPCFLPLREDVCGNHSSMCGRRGLLSYQSRCSNIPSMPQGDWQYFSQARKRSDMKCYSWHTYVTSSRSKCGS